MSIRFFDEILFDVHNLAMATDRHQAPSYPLRMPDDLKAKIADSADANGRSLHAELLLRLSESFRLNQADADTSQARLQLAESKLKETQVMQHALHLGHCVMFLLQALGGPDPKGALKAFPDLINTAEEAATAALEYERELSPAKRLEEYRLAIEEAKDLLLVWRANMLPLFGDIEIDDAGEKPKKGAEVRKQLEAAVGRKQTDARAPKARKKP